MSKSLDYKFIFTSHLRAAASAFESGQNCLGTESNAAIAAFDSMLFECARARRIARDAPSEVEDLGLDSKEFLGVMDDVAAVRNIMEHWADVINPRAQEPHEHITKAGLKIAVDASSIIILGRDEIYKGKLNLYDVYQYVVVKLEQMDRRT